MFHSVTINGKNTWDDYHMVPVEGIYVPDPPEQKVTTIDLKAANGLIDVSTLLTGYPVFNNRQGDLQYYILEPSDVAMYAEVGGSQNNLDYPSAYEAYSMLLNDIHGQTGTMFFEDDPLWEYKGKFTVTSFVTNALRRTVIIHYEVAPYKTKRTATTKSISGTGSFSYLTLGPDELGTMPNNPIVTISGLPSATTCQVQIVYPPYTNTAKTITKTIGVNTSVRYADFLFYKNAKLGFNGPSGSTATFTFNPGRF